MDRNPNECGSGLHGRDSIEQVGNISTHINTLIDAETLERLGATPERPLHIRVMRILCDYNTVREELEQLKRVLRQHDLRLRHQFLGEPIKQHMTPEQLNTLRDIAKRTGQSKEAHARRRPYKAFELTVWEELQARFSRELDALDAAIREGENKNDT